MERHIYLAGPLFSYAERQFMASLRDRMCQLPDFEVTWPGDLFDDAHLSGLGPAAKQHIFEGCRDAIHAATLVVAVLDGPQVDDGSAWEVGPQAPNRQAGETAHSLANAMIECACSRIFRSPDNLLDALDG
jgi:nucleoside 2-deoxyribosyltransferase